MTRDVAALSARTFDLLVIGGGIYGLTIAADAAQRGLSVAVVERDDFGSGSTFNHLRTIHGGLRYLQTLDVARARESIRERHTLADIAPRFVRPLPFVLPLTARWFRGPAMMSAGLRLDALIAGDRNHHLPASHHLPQGRVIPADAARARFPWLRDRPMRAAAVWYDYVVTESDRLTFAWVIAAATYGATVVNHMAATQLLVDDRQRVVGARVHDATTDRSHEVSARLTVNATGGDVDGLLAAAGTAIGTPMLRAMNLVTTLAGGDAAIGAQTPSGRALFMVPWRGRALFGTWESAGTCAPSERQPGEHDIAAFVEQVAAAYPDCRLRREDVTLVHRGIVPAIRRRDGHVTLDGREHVHDHAGDPVPVSGLLSVAGTKFTTARAVAERVTDRVFAKLGQAPAPCRTASLALPGLVPAVAAAAASSPANDWPADVRDHLAAVFGDAAAMIRAVASERPGLGDRLSPDSPVIAAQIVWAARHELAVTLADAVIRRTPLGALGYPGREVLGRAAAVMADELGWDPARTAAEIAAVAQFYGRDAASATAPGRR